MKTLEQLAKEFVCDVGCEPTENQEYEIGGLVTFAKAAFKECQLTPVAADLAPAPHACNFEHGLHCPTCGKSVF